jgi:hypothetical protein
MKTKGKFFWKKRWYSYCSRHHEHDYRCNLCDAGSWEYVWLVKVEQIIYKISPKFWNFFKKRNK